MNEYEIYTLMNSGLTANAIYGASVFFLLWVAFRAANQVRAEDGNAVVKSLVSLFSLGKYLMALLSVQYLRTCYKEQHLIYLN